MEDTRLELMDLGFIVLTNFTNMETLAKGEKECQEAMEKLLEGAK